MLTFDSPSLGDISTRLCNEPQGLTLSRTTVTIPFGLRRFVFVFDYEHTHTDHNHYEAYQQNDETERFTKSLTPLLSLPPGGHVIPIIIPPFLTEIISLKFVV